MNFKVWREGSVFTATLLVAIPDAAVDQDSQDENDHDLVREHTDRYWQISNPASRNLELVSVQSLVTSIAEILGYEPESAQRCEEEQEGEAIDEGVIGAFALFPVAGITWGLTTTSVLFTAFNFFSRKTTYDRNND